MTNVYHIAGLDDRERGFNRQAQVIIQEESCQARLRYETLQIEVGPVDTEEEALKRLIHALQTRGYTQLRTQRIFQGDQYLGNQELWVEYPDPDLPDVQPISWWGWLRKLFGSGQEKQVKGEK